MGKRFAVKLKKKKLTFHQPKIYLQAQALFAQDHIDVAPPVDFYSGTGEGFSFAVSGETRGHFEVKLSIVQAMERGTRPFFLFSNIPV